MRNYSAVGGLCIRSPAQKGATRNSAARRAVYSGFSTFDGRALTARRICRMFAEWFVNLLTSPLN
jgi:hypothetical protein